MAWDGWIEYNGEEFINIARTTQLAEAMGIDSVWINSDEVSWVETALGGSAYDDVTEAPWYDPGFPASAEFAGILPLSLQGLDDSTLTSTPVEYTGDGGNSGRARNATLSIVASVAIVAKTERGADYGKRWMDRRLRDSGDKMFCSGADLRYFRYDASDSPKAHRRNVRLTRGSSVTRKRTTDCASVWLVTFTWTAADPYEYGEESPLLWDLGGGQVSTPDSRLVTNWAVYPAGTNTAAVGAYWPGGAGSLAVVSAAWAIRGKAVRLTCTTAATGACDAGPRIGGSPFALTPGNTYTVEWDIVTSKATTLNIPTLAGGTATGFSVKATSGAAASTAGTPLHRWTTFVAGTGTDARIGNQISAPAAGDWVEISNIVIYDGTRDATIGYIDGSLASGPGHIYAWLGTPDASTSTLSTANASSLVLTQTDCPAYDYSPIYDPLYPALVPSPTAPNLIPDGWDITTGTNFERFWAKLDPIEPTSLDLVPIITLTSTEEARMVRVSIWDSEAVTSDQCDPLFCAVVSYLPPNVSLIIDGEQEASYVWDDVSPVVRRADSLVYAPDASPVQWAKFNDPVGLMVTLDVFSDSDGYQGDGNVRVALSVVPKSD